jgi:cytochrome b pre-mRNA-processing protein 3
MGLFSFFKRTTPAQEAAKAIYGAVVAQARNPLFYAELGVPDTVDGRFDMIVAHAMLVMRRLRVEGEAGAETAQELFDYMFKDMDRSLRELGVGDMSIGKHIKKMSKAFYGRAEEYEKGIDGSDAEMAAALRANVFRKATPSPKQLQVVGAYLRAAAARLAQVESSSVTRGALPWPVIDLTGAA